MRTCPENEEATVPAHDGLDVRVSIQLADTLFLLQKVGSHHLDRRLQHELQVTEGREREMRSRNEPKLATMPMRGVGLDLLPCLFKIANSHSDLGLG